MIPCSTNQPFIYLSPAQFRSIEKVGKLTITQFPGEVRGEVCIKIISDFGEFLAYMNTTL